MTSRNAIRCSVTAVLIGHAAAVVAADPTHFAQLDETGNCQNCDLSGARPYVATLRGDLTDAPLDDTERADSKSNHVREPPDRWR